MRTEAEIPAEIEEYRDERWRREATRQIETALDAERFIEQVGFAACLTDSRRPGRRSTSRSAAGATPSCRATCRKTPRRRSRGS